MATRLPQVSKYETRREYRFAFHADTIGDDPLQLQVGASATSPRTIIPAIQPSPTGGGPSPDEQAILTMRFSRDLAREILLNIEEKWGPHGPSQSQIENLGTLAPGTPMDSIHYHLRKLKEAGFVVLSVTSIRSKSDEPGRLQPYPASLTYAGHQFLDDIRDPGRWERIKKTAGSMSFTTMKALMPEIVKKVIEL